MEDSGLTSLTIRRGVTQEEFRVLLTELARPLEEAQRAPTFWRGVLEGRGIRTIEVGTHTYTAAAGVESPPETTTGQNSEAEELSQRGVQWLNNPLGAFLESQVQEEIAHVLGKLRGIGREDLAQQLVERTTGVLGELDGSLRRQASEGLLISLKGVDGESADWLLDVVLDPIADVMRTETHSEAFQGQVELSTEILRRLSHRRNLVRGVPLAEALTRPRSGVHGDHAVEPIRKFVDPLAPHFLKLILEDEDTEGSRVAATLLRVQGNVAVRQLSQELGRATSVEKRCRIVTVLDVVAPALASDFFFLLGHPRGAGPGRDGPDDRATLVTAGRPLPAACDEPVGP